MRRLTLTQHTVRCPLDDCAGPALSVEEDLKITPGEHAVTVTFTPAESGDGGKPLTFEGRVRFSPARVVLITYENGRLIAR
jgi:hypothetical protein